MIYNADQTVFSNVLTHKQYKSTFHKILRLSEDAYLYCLKENKRCYVFSAVLDTDLYEKNPVIRLEFVKSSYIISNFGWRNYNRVENFKHSLRKIPEFSYFLKTGHTISVTRKNNKYLVTNLGDKGEGFSIEDAYFTMWVNRLRVSGLDLLGSSWENQDEN